MKKTKSCTKPIESLSSQPSRPRAKAKPAAHSSAASRGQEPGQLTSANHFPSAGLPTSPSDDQAGVATQGEFVNTGGGGGAAAPDSSAGQVVSATHETDAGQDQGQKSIATHVVAALIQNIQSRYRLRIFYREAADAVAKRLYAYCYLITGADFDHTKPGQKAAHAAAAKKLTDRTLKGDPPFELMAMRCDLLLDHYRAMKQQQVEREKEINKLVEGLPAWGWVQQFKGLGPGGFGEIVAHAGDLGQYSGPAKLWKRMGLGLVQQPDGSWVRQRRCKDKDAAALHAYSPRRRSVMYSLGDSLLRARRFNPAMGELYDTHKANKLALGWTKFHAHNHALRVIEKRLLRELWRAWRGGGGADVIVSPQLTVPPSSSQTRAEGVAA